MKKQKKSQAAEADIFPEIAPVLPNKLSVLGRVGIIAVVLLLVASVSAAGYFYIQLNKAKISSESASVEESASIIAAVGKLMVLPTGEEPTLATVTDPDKLRKQEFFASAQKGDRVLIYTKAKKAILYNPTENKIIEVAPVNIGDIEKDPQVSGSLINQENE